MFLIVFKIYEKSLTRSLLMNYLLTTFNLTYHKILIFQNSSHDALIRSFQMALSLRDISLMEGGELSTCVDSSLSWAYILGFLVWELWCRIISNVGHQFERKTSVVFVTLEKKKQFLVFLEFPRYMLKYISVQKLSLKRKRTMFEHLLKEAIVLLRNFASYLFGCKSFVPTISGPLPPSRRRSLFTLAASMVLFSSKAFNLFSLADFTKVALQGPRVRLSFWWKCFHVDVLFLFELLHAAEFVTQYYRTL